MFVKDVKGGMYVVKLNHSTNECGWIQHRPRRTPPLLPRCSCEDMGLISLIPSHWGQIRTFFPFACSALYICTKPRLPSAFSFSALGAACPVFVLHQALRLFSSLTYSSRPPCCFNIHTNGTESTSLHAWCKILWPWPLFEEGSWFVSSPLLYKCFFCMPAWIMISRREWVKLWCKASYLIQGCRPAFESEICFCEQTDLNSSFTM